MFTRCPQCETTFRLGAADLRRAAGKVRCGDCDAVFNALEFLEEEATSADAAQPPSPSDIATPVDQASTDTDEFIPESGTDTDVLYDDNYVFPDDEESEPQDAADGGYAPETPGADVPDSTDAPAEDHIDELRESGEAHVSMPDSDDEPTESAIADEFTTDEQPEFTVDDNIVSFLPLDSETGQFPEPGFAIPDPDPTEDEAGVEEEEQPLKLSDEQDTADSDDEIDVEFTISDADEHLDAAEENLEEAASQDQELAEPPVADDFADEFDDSVWERIPGVGAIANEPHDAASAQEDSSAEHWDDSEPDNWEEIHEGDELEITTEPTVPELPNLEEAGYLTEANDDGEGGVPSEADEPRRAEPQINWSNIFSRATETFSQGEPENDTAAHPVLPASESPVVVNEEDLSEWARELQADESTAGEDDEDGAEETADGDAGITKDDGGAAEHAESQHVLDEDEDGIAERTEPQHVLDEQDATLAADAGEPESSAEDTEEWWQELEQDEDAENTAQNGEVATAATEDYSAEPHEGPEAGEATATDYAAATGEFMATGRYDEAEYDVQHIILADESEPEETEQTGGAAELEEPPPWQSENTAEEPARRSGTMLWPLAGLLVVITLGVQLVHYNRDALAGNLAWGETVRSAYESIGLQLYPNWSLDNYEIRSSEAIAGETAADVMDIRAQIAAIGKQATGLPHIRIVLRDRWSNPVAARTLPPEQYLERGDLPASGLLQPNETLAAHVSIVDPGSGAQGFELELCLPRRHTGLECTGRPFN